MKQRAFSVDSNKVEVSSGAEVQMSVPFTEYKLSIHQCSSRAAVLIYLISCTLTVGTV